MFEQIISASKGKQIVMFLDYDGTLSPIVEDPDRAFMTHEVSSIFSVFFYMVISNLINYIYIYTYIIYLFFVN